MNLHPAVIVLNQEKMNTLNLTVEHLLLVLITVMERDSCSARDEHLDVQLSHFKCRLNSSRSALGQLYNLHQHVVGPREEYAQQQQMDWSNIFNQILLSVFVANCFFPNFRLFV
jgi:hypothetical protein